MSPDQPESDPVPEEISELLQERATYSGWLERLDELEEEVRPEVHRPVADDYRKRLSAVESELAEHRSELEEALRERESEKKELSGELEERRRSREEARLRHRVGEYSDEEWEAEREEHDARIETLQEQLEVEKGAVAELREVVSAVAEAARGGGEQGEGRVAEAAPGPDGAAEEPERAPAADEPESTGGRRGGSPKDGGEEGYRDELEFLESLSLDDPEQFDAVSSMLDEEEGEGRPSGESGTDDDAGEAGDGGDRT